MLDVTPANCCDELDVVDAARLKPVKFHTSKETSFCWTLNGSSRRSAFWWTRSLALRDDMLVRLTSTFWNCCVWRKLFCHRCIFLHGCIFCTDLVGSVWKSWMMSLIVISYIVTNGGAGLVFQPDLELRVSSSPLLI